MAEGEEELWDPEGSKTLGEHGARESTKQGSWVLTKTEAAITEHTRVCRSALGPLLTLRLFAWCLGAAPDRGKGGVSDSFAFSPYCVTSSSLCVRICAYCCILFSVFS